MSELPFFPSELPLVGLGLRQLFGGLWVPPLQCPSGRDGAEPATG